MKKKRNKYPNGNNSSLKNKIKEKKNSLKESLYIGRHFKKEFKKQMRLLITITLAFTIAFTWRQTIFDFSEAIMNLIFDFKSKVASSFAASLTITLICIFLIYLTSQWLKDHPYDRY